MINTLITLVFFVVLLGISSHLVEGGDLFAKNCGKDGCGEGKDCLTALTACGLQEAIDRIETEGRVILDFNGADWVIEKSLSVAEEVQTLELVGGSKDYALLVQETETFLNLTGAKDSNPVRVIFSDLHFMKFQAQSLMEGMRRSFLYMKAVLIRESVMKFRGLSSIVQVLNSRLEETKFFFAISDYNQTDADKNVWDFQDTTFSGVDFDINRNDFNFRQDGTFFPPTFVSIRKCTFQDSSQLSIGSISESVPTEFQLRCGQHLYGSKFTVNIEDTVFKDGDLFDDGIQSSWKAIVKLTDIASTTVKRTKWLNNKAHFGCISFEEIRYDDNKKRFISITDSEFRGQQSGGTCLDFHGDYVLEMERNDFVDNIMDPRATFMRGVGALRFAGVTKSSKGRSSPYFGTTINNCLFKGNQGNRGGAIGLFGGALNLKITNSIFKENGAQTAGGSIYIDAENVKIEDSVFIKNIGNDKLEVNDPGGCLQLDRGNAYFYNASFYDNLGGAISSQSGSGSFIVQGGEFINNDYGIYLNHEARQVTFYINPSLAQFKTDFSLQQWEIPSFFNTTTFFEGSSKGAIQAMNFRAIFANRAVMRRNKAKKGGAIQLFFERRSQIFSMNTSLIQENVAEEYGGGIMVAGKQGTFQVDPMTRIEDCSAKYGGGLYSDIFTSCSVKFQATLARNRASLGSGVFSAHNPVVLKDKQLIQNHQHTSPKTIRIDLGSYKMENGRYVVQCQHVDYKNSIYYVKKGNCTIRGIQYVDDIQNILHYRPPILEAPEILWTHDVLPYAPSIESFSPKRQPGSDGSIVEKNYELNFIMKANEEGHKVPLEIRHKNSTLKFYFILPSCPSGLHSDGEQCIESGLKWLVGVLLGVLGFVALIAVCSLGLCSCLVLFLRITSYYNRKKLKKYQKLGDDIDYLLLENEHRKSNYKLKASLFEIPFSDVKIKKRLGSGGSGAIVFEGTYQNNPVAFKVFKPTSLNGDQDSFYEDFEREVITLSVIRHPNCIRFIGCSIKPPRVGIVQELCELGSLREYMVNRKEIGETAFKWSEKLRLLLEVARGMQYLHARSIIHRDLKLDNILLTTNGDTQLVQAKIIDFGLSKVQSKYQQDNTMRVGTSYFIAPEVIKGSHYDTSCDIFSFSIVCYIVSTENFDPYNTSDSIGSRDFISPELRVANDPDFRPDLPENIDEDKKWFYNMVVDCWHHDPKNRPTFDEIVKMFVSHTDGD